MKERSIIMSTESVRAILAGRKTQTRRVCKPQPVLSEGRYRYDGRHEHIQNGAPAVELLDSNGEPTEKYFDCRIPRFEPGDRIWVKEKYGYDRESKLVFSSDRKDDRLQEWAKLVSWKNPMFMPKRFSRLTLEVLDVRLERLQDIAIEDAMCEGCPYSKKIASEHIFKDSKDRYIPNAIVWYQCAWDKINFNRGFPWASNPWVWVIDFKRIEKEAT